MPYAPSPPRHLAICPESCVLFPPPVIPAPSGNPSPSVRPYYDPLPHHGPTQKRQRGGAVIPENRAAICLESSVPLRKRHTSPQTSRPPTPPSFTAICASALPGLSKRQGCRGGGRVCLRSHPRLPPNPHPPSRIFSPTRCSDSQKQSAKIQVQIKFQMLLRIKAL
jgi:hypothetical protein